MVFVPIYIVILGTTIVVDYFAGIYLEKVKGSKRKWLLIASLIANIGALALFKYFNFLNENLSFFLNSLGYSNHIPNLSILLPIGLSFHTFQAMSYTIEVYKNNQKAERNFFIYALYVMFYPQLVAGPIERPQNMLHQFYEKHYFNYDRVVSGLRLMLWGLFKKVVIADRLAMITDKIYGDPYSHGSVILFIATLSFAFQIYCDFSGYSDIAIGAARVMGFKLMQNFNNPYSAKSISEFWHRWHISLSSWFRDYLYIPLGGNRKGLLRQYFNVFIVFVVSGLWHGANWTYVIWGALHGVFTIAESIIKQYLTVYKIKIYEPLSRFFGNIITFSFVVYAWIFFRASNLKEAVYISKNFIPNIIEIKGYSIENVLFYLKSELGVSYFYIVILIIAVIFMLFLEKYQETLSMDDFMNSKPRWFRWGVYYSFILAIFVLGVFENRKFIYFQF